jgi:hypothetical protein
MAFVLPDVGEVIFLTRILTAENSRLHLYSNNYTPVEGSVIGGFTELVASGYANIALTGTVSSGTWAIATVSGTSAASYPQQTYTLTASGTAYGYYLTNNANDALLLAELFTDGPYVIPAGGGTIKVTPNISAS